MTKSARVTAAEKKLAPLARRINAQLNCAGKNDKKADDNRLAAAIHLAEAKGLAKELKVGFNTWCDEHIKELSSDYVAKLARVGEAADPALALADMRTGTRKTVAKVRKPKETALRSAVSEEPAKAIAHVPVNAFTAATDAVMALPDNDRTAVVDHAAHEAGMVVMPAAEVKILREHVDAAKEQKDISHSIEGFKDIFKSFGMATRMDLARWVAKEVGAELHMLNPQDKFGELSDIPAILDQRPQAKRGSKKRKTVWKTA